MKSNEERFVIATNLCDIDFVIDAKENKSGWYFMMPKMNWWERKNAGILMLLFMNARWQTEML